ncbi:serine hydrolase domain-containing protein [Streptomyces griseocarneus]|uniref:serine hydrolase domain-containing protein n=1 Tax=Streptomyces griseocarneus TaxID=51201 RepID=UPI00167EEE38|nr:serine hydrolase domain-containing protein [Streptomyces griseocarneus]MBZ6476877.1 beta-lactamase family protein [Streptomyces griseocarneus]GHG80927.1 serine hydrolase [Streptomyces griseocarneus]
MPTRVAFPRLTAAMAALSCAVAVSVTTGGGGAVARSPVEDLVSERTVPGAAELSQDTHGAVRFTTAGVADVATGRRILPTDRFRAGSITKTFIATVVLQLAAEHRLDLDDPATAHLPAGAAAALRHSGRDRPVTVRQLLGHTSGLFSYTDDRAFFRRVFGAGFAAHRYERHTAGALLRTALAHPAYGPPGRLYRYSNTDYLLLGMVIRQVTGHSYAAEARRRVITPLRLTGTSFPGLRTTLPAPHGRAYSPSGPGRAGGLADVTDLNPSAAGAAGELVSTLPDLNRFFAALLGGALLPPAQLRAMRDTSASGGRYGLGLFPVRLPCHRTVWGHNGEINGSYVQSLATADGRRVVSYRVNSDARIPRTAEAKLLSTAFCPTDGTGPADRTGWTG